jgi:hypothetical protein
MKSRILTREELYRLVWSKPATKLADELGISDVAITKLCRRHNIPKPWPGYWRILEAGHTRKIPSLPAHGPQESNEIETNKPQLPALPPQVLDMIDQEKLAASRIVVPSDLENSHPVIRRAQTLFKKAEHDNYNRLWFSSYKMEKPKLDISVSREALDRTLRILAAVMHALEARGHGIKVHEDLAQAVVNGERVRFAVKEKVNRSERTKKERAESREYEKWKYTPTGELTLSISSWASGIKSKWKDIKDHPLEEQVNEILIGILKHAALSPAARLAWEENKRVQEQLRQEAEQRRIQDEIRRYEYRMRCEALEAQFALWMKSHQLRAFLKECEESLSLADEPEANNVKERWLSWAQKHADSLDPFKNGGLREIIGRFDRARSLFEFPQRKADFPSNRKEF